MTAALPRHQFMSLTLGAYRRELITRRKLAELGRLLDLDDESVDRLLLSAGLEHEIEMGAEDVRLPE